MRMHEKGQLYDGIRYRDGKINLERNQNINQINFIGNNTEDNRFIATKANQIKIDIKKSEDISMQNLNFDKKINPNYEDIMMKEETKHAKFKK